MSGLLNIVRSLVPQTAIRRWLRAQLPRTAVRQWLRRHATAPRAFRVIVESNLFDEQWYRATCPKMTGTREDLIRHYARIGFRQGRNPTPLFDTSFYLEQNSDVA